MGQTYLSHSSALAESPSALAADEWLISDVGTYMPHDFLALIETSTFVGSITTVPFTKVHRLPVPNVLGGDMIHKCSGVLE